MSFISDNSTFIYLILVDLFAAHHNDSVSIIKIQCGCATTCQSIINFGIISGVERSKKLTTSKQEKTDNGVVMKNSDYCKIPE